jgi:glycosyltransferase involved in cell wall biosynthesis
MRLPVVATLHDYGFVCPKMSLLKKGAEICLKRRADFGCISCASESYGPIKSVVVTAAMRNFASIIKRASALIAVSHHVARVAEESGLAEVQVIPPFIDLENVRSMAQDNAHRFTWVDILYGGGNKPWKGFQIFADSMRKIKDAGSSLTFDVGDLKSTKRGGALPREEYLGRLAKSRILVVPSISPEAFGLAAVEGMALGRAVIASDIGGLSEIIEDQRSGLLIPPGRSDALAQSILRLGNDPQLCDRLGKQAQEVADIKFGAVNTLQPLEKLYESVVQ